MADLFPRSGVSFADLKEVSRVSHKRFLLLFNIEECGFLPIYWSLFGVADGTF